MCEGECSYKLRGSPNDDLCVCIFHFVLLLTTENQLRMMVVMMDLWILDVCKLQECFH